MGDKLYEVHRCLAFVKRRRHFHREVFRALRTRADGTLIDPVPADSKECLGRFLAPTKKEAIYLARVSAGERKYECRGKGRGGLGQCCDRVGEYNGYASDGPLAFVCPAGCSCHD